MHLDLAGRLRWVAAVDAGMAQIYDPDGRPFSAPVLCSEAGITAPRTASAARPSPAVSEGACRPTTPR